MKNHQELEKGTVTNFTSAMSYGDYLHIDQILTAQHPISGHHDETLFIIIHQVSELWMKLILHEVSEAKIAIVKKDYSSASKMLARVSKTQQQLIASWNVLSTLTPSEYLEFRDDLGNSSGFQSYQNRMIEFYMGNKNARMLEVFRHRPDLYDPLKEILESTSLYDTVIKNLVDHGFTINDSCLNRDWSKPYEANQSVEDAWFAIYKNVGQYWELYELAEKLVDIGSQMQIWRYNHMVTVERIIGHKTGTGGTSGVGYLKKALDIQFFPELYSVRTRL